MNHKVTLAEIKNIGEISKIIISHASSKKWKQLSIVYDLTSGDKFFLVSRNSDGITESQKAWNLETAINYYNEY